VECGQHFDPNSLKNVLFVCLFVCLFLFFFESILSLFCRNILVFLNGEREETDKKPKVLECLGRELVREGPLFCFDFK
jgi:hypothetical protein